MDFVSRLIRGSPWSRRRKACHVRGTFLSLLLKEMRQGLEPDTLFGHDSVAAMCSAACSISSWPSTLTQSGGVGLAKTLNQQLKSRCTPPLTTTEQIPSRGT